MRPQSTAAAPVRGVLMVTGVARQLFLSSLLAASVFTHARSRRRLAADFGQLPAPFRPIDCAQSRDPSIETAAAAFTVTSKA